MQSEPTFTPNQILNGERLELQPVTRDDFDRLYAVASDPQIWQQHPQWDRYKEHVFQDYFDGAVESQSAYLVIDKASGQVIGSSRFHNPDFEHSSVEIGWTFLACAYWGGSFNAELKDIMLKFAFSCFEEVHFCIGEDNLRSQRAASKLGASRSDKADPARPGNYIYVLHKDDYVGLAKYGSI